MLGLSRFALLEDTTLGLPRFALLEATTLGLSRFALLEAGSLGVALALVVAAFEVSADAGVVEQTVDMAGGVEAFVV
jgi:hypothetical protein